MVRHVTAGEKLLIERRRAGQSQRDRAAVLEVTLYRYRRWEADEERGPLVDVGALEPHETCHLRRRRAGISLEDMAEVLDVSRWWVCQMEYGRAGADRLVRHWTGVDRPWRPEAKANA